MNSSMNPGNKHFLIKSGSVRSGFIDPIMGKTMYNGNTESTAIRKPLKKLEVRPRKEQISLGLMTMYVPNNTAIAITRSVVNELDIDPLGILSHVYTCHAYPQSEYTKRQAITAKITLAVLDFKITILFSFRRREECITSSS